MNLSNRVKYWMMAVMLMLLTSCINEDFSEQNPENRLPSDFYIALSVSLPSDAETRTETNDKGTSGIEQTGRTNENKIVSATLFFYDKKSGEHICNFSAFQTRLKDVSTDDLVAYTLTAKLEKEHLLALAGKEVYLYVVANTELPYYPNGLTQNALEEMKFTATRLSGSPIGEFGKGNEGKYCAMSNRREYNIDLRSIVVTGEGADKEKQLLDRFSQLFNGTYKEGGLEGKLWDISNGNISTLYKGSGNLELERSVARIDFKPKNGTDLPLNVYELNGTKGEVYLKIVSMQLFNVSKEAFTFRHITREGTRTDGNGYSAKIFGTENGYASGSTSYNWVYDTDWDFKKSPTIKDDALNSGELPYFLNQPQTEKISEEEIIWSVPGTDGLTTISELTSNTEGEDEDGYFPWHYLMENTLPSTSKMSLQLSTGIAFRMVVCDREGNPLQGTEGSTYRITMAKDGSFQLLKYEKGKTDNEPTGYYLTYRYLIEHNKPENSGNINGGDTSTDNLGPMQRGVVRNNIYRISVDGINNLPNPHDADNFYLAIDIKVLPWVKRKVIIDYW